MYQQLPLALTGCSWQQKLRKCPLHNRVWFAINYLFIEDRGQTLPILYVIVELCLNFLDKCISGVIIIMTCHFNFRGRVRISRVRFLALAIFELHSWLPNRKRARYPYFLYWLRFSLMRGNISMLSTNQEFNSHATEINMRCFRSCLMMKKACIRVIRNIFVDVCSLQPHTWPAWLAKAKPLVQEHPCPAIRRKKGLRWCYKVLVPILSTYLQALK